MKIQNRFSWKPESDIFIFPSENVKKNTFQKKCYYIQFFTRNDIWCSSLEQIFYSANVYKQKFNAHIFTV